MTIEAVTVSAPFARILAAGRALFNARIAQAARRSAAFDSDAFRVFLTHAVDPVVAAVYAVSPDRAAAAALSACDMALALAGHGLIGSQTQHSLIGQTWARLFPALGQQIAEAPLAVLGSLSNAAHYLGRTPGLRGEEWLARMGALAPGVAVPDLLTLGKVLAWRAGAAHFRASALDVADTLPEALANAAVGAVPESRWADVRDQLVADPWWSPEAGRVLERQVGDFTGFGGSFSQPPELRADAAGFWVNSGERFSRLIVDVWGAVLQPAGAENFAAAPAPPSSPAPCQQGNRLVFSRRRVDLDWPAEGLSVVCNETTAAAVSIYSHQIRLFALP